ncbi:DUF3443 family protein [Paraburkholderia sp. GAS199]|uniref:DUF3443 family protein n=1 Tax=Paraburkholderia sp. GAS199 TaxID=3035126 RepID=UPI003D1F1D7B
MNQLKHALWIAIAGAAFALSACGGGNSSQGSNTVGWNATPDWITPPGSGTSGGGQTNNGQAAPGANTVPISVDTSAGGINRAYVTIKLCVPGAVSDAQCATVDHVILDTGSTGLRISARAIPALAPMLLTQAGASDDKDGSSPIEECLPFVSGFTWGSIKRADVTIGPKTASNIPIQVVSDGAFAVPSECVAHNGTDLGDRDLLPGNGILGIDNFTADSADALTSATPPLYYYCTSQTNCVATRMTASKEVRNPVTAFASDNNGTVIRLPAVPAGGQASVTGQLVFGVSTQSNNMLPSTAKILTLDKYGNFTTQYKGRVYNWSAIDSGTPTYAFPDDSIPTADGFYTPSNPISLMASMESTNGTGSPISMTFNVANAISLLANNFAAYDSLGENYSNSKNAMFLWGLPFFYGRDVYTVIGNVKIGNQTGPFTAF